MADGGIQLEEEGIKLICEYYRTKYQINVELIGGTNEENPFTLFLKRIRELLPKIQKEEGDYRIGFLLGLTSHTTPIFYLQEDDDAGFLIADSLGQSQSSAAALYEATGIPVYWIEDPRQYDKYSCYADGVITIKDITRKKSDRKGYQYSNILDHFASFAEDLNEYDDSDLDDESERLKSFCKEDKNDKPKYQPTLFPDILLKTAQLKPFMDKHDLGTNFIIHKMERLKEFRQRFTNDRDLPSYLFEKGLKFSRIIVIQFYLNQMKNLMKDNWNDDLTNKFIKEAKQFILNLESNVLSSRLRVFSNQFWQKKQYKNNANSR